MVFLRVVFLLWGFCLMAGCQKSSHQTNQQIITIYAASSLTDVVTALKRDFEVVYPGTHVETVFAGSHILSTQLAHGARADVMMSANLAHVQTLRAKQLVKHITPLLHNHLVVVVPKDSPLHHWRQIQRAKRIVIGLGEAPIGQYTQQLLSQQGAEFKRDVLTRVVSQEVDVRTVLMRVHTGQADAAIVYQTDVQPHHRVKMLTIPHSENVRASYHVGVLRPKFAKSWLVYLRSSRGQRIIKQHGFMAL